MDVIEKIKKAVATASQKVSETATSSAQTIAESASKTAQKVSEMANRSAQTISVQAKATGELIAEKASKTGQWVESYTQTAYDRLCEKAAVLIRKMIRGLNLQGTIDTLVKYQSDTGKDVSQLINFIVELKKIGEDGEE